MKNSLSISPKSKSAADAASIMMISLSISPKSKSAADASSARNCVTELNPDESPLNESTINHIDPILNEWRPVKQRKNQIEFELDGCLNPEATDTSMAYGLNLRQPPNGGNGGLTSPESR